MLVEIKVIGCWPVPIHRCTCVFICIQKIIEIKHKTMVLWHYRTFNLFHLVSIFFLLLFIFSHLCQCLNYLF